MDASVIDVCCGRPAQRDRPNIPWNRLPDPRDVTEEASLRTRWALGRRHRPRECATEEGTKREKFGYGQLWGLL